MLKIRKSLGLGTIIGMLLIPVSSWANTLPIITVNGVEIAMRDLDDELTHLVQQGNPDTAQLREYIKQQLITQELFFQAAIKAGIEKQPDVRAAVEHATRSIIIDRYLQQALHPEPISDAQIKTFYEKIKSNAGPKEYQLRLIKVSTRKEADEVVSKLKQGSSFAELAHRYSQANSVAKEGSMGWVSFKTPVQENHTNGLPFPIAQFLEKTEKGGEISTPIAWQNHYWLVKVENVRPTQVPVFKSVERELRRTLAVQSSEKAAKQLAMQLREHAEIQVN